MSGALLQYNSIMFDIHYLQTFEHIQCLFVYFVTAVWNLKVHPLRLLSVIKGFMIFIYF